MMFVIRQLECRETVNVEIDGGFDCWWGGGLLVVEKHGGGGIFVCESVLSEGVRFWLEKNRKKNRSDCLDWAPCEDERQHFHLDERIHLSRYPKIA